MVAPNKIHYPFTNGQHIAGAAFLNHANFASTCQQEGHQHPKAQGDQLAIHHQERN